MNDFVFCQKYECTFPVCACRKPTEVERLRSALTKIAEYGGPAEITAIALEALSR